MWVLISENRDNSHGKHGYNEKNKEFSQFLRPIISQRRKNVMIRPYIHQLYDRLNDILPRFETWQGKSTNKKKTFSRIALIRME